MDNLIPFLLKIWLIGAPTITTFKIINRFSYLPAQFLCDQSGVNGKKSYLETKINEHIVAGN